MQQNPFPKPRFTYGDYSQWVDGERWELIDGEALLMSPAPTRLHQQLVLKLARQIDEFLDNHPCEVYVAPFDVRLPRADEADEQVDTVVQPDLAVICDPHKLDDKGCRGAPDWIIEVLSPHTAALDRNRKLGLYARHGVREYWIVDPRERSLELHRSPAAAGYGESQRQPARGRTEVTMLPGLLIHWNRVFGD